jgi:hypothetical protein
LPNPEDGVSPGPGQYDVQEAFPNSSKATRPPALSIAAKTSFGSASFETASPGPAAYPPTPIENYIDARPSRVVKWEINHVETLPPELREHREQLMSTYKPISPGPGAYKPEESSKFTAPRAPAFTHRQNNPLKKEEMPEGPGPAAYTLPAYMGKGMAISISARTLHISDKNAPRPASDEVPGPGQYHLGHSESTPILRRSSSFSFGANQHRPKKNKLANLITASTNHLVGPGRYTPNYAAQAGRKRAPQPTIIGQPRPRRKQEPTPGPSYVYKPQRKEWTISKKLNYEDRMSAMANYPGPGLYEVGTAWNNAKGLTTTHFCKRGAAFGSLPPSKTYVDHREFKSPVDPAYIKRRAPSAHFQGKPKGKTSASGPGPGNYNHKSSFSTQKIYRL